MSTLVLDRANLIVRNEGSTLMVHQGDNGKSAFPVKLIERVIIQGTSIQIGSGALLRLAEQGASVLFLSPRSTRRIALVLGPAHNDAAIRLAQAGLVGNGEFRQQWSHQIVDRKIARQRRLLCRLRQHRPDCRLRLGDALTTLDALQKKVSEGATTVDSLRGLEGSAAAAYFRGFCSVFPEAANFRGRNRRPPRDPVNACLSLAYTLLHFEAVRAAHIAGLDPLLGFYHRPAFGRESLACDLVEPLRPSADAWIWRLIAERDLRLEHFTQDKGACLLGKAGRGRFYESWERFAPAPRRYLRRTCTGLVRMLREREVPKLEHLLAQGDDDELLA